MLVLAHATACGRTNVSDDKSREPTRSISMEELARRHSVSIRTAWSWVAAGLVRVFKVGRLTRLSEAEAERFAAAMQAGEVQW
jgi:hypothetical protein